MQNLLATIAVYGDLHLSSKNYGAHKNYPVESIEYLQKLTEVCKRLNVTHLIGCGDLTFGRFNTLEYRLAVEHELEEQNNLTHGKHWELKGNHDIAGYGLVERDYYIEKGLLRGSEELEIGSLTINMIDYGKSAEPLKIVNDTNHINIAIAHDYFKFKDTQLPNFGDAIELDNYTNFYGLDYLFCGHIHKILNFKGYIVKDGVGHELNVGYLGCMMRPAYREGYMDDKGLILILKVYADDVNPDITYLEISSENIDLWPLDKSFNLDEKAVEQEKKAEKEARVDISDIVKQLDAHDRNVGNPEDIINSLDGVDSRYKEKAIQLLHDALG